MLSSTLDAPINNLTLQTSPGSSLFVATILAIGHWLHSASFFKRTMSPTLQFLSGIFHFVLDWRLNTSFLHLFQNSLQICWTLLQCFLQYWSGDAKTPGGGITIFDFIVRRFIGLSGIRLVTSLIVSVVNEWEMTTASTSTSRVCND